MAFCGAGCSNVKKNCNAGRPGIARTKRCQLPQTTQGPVLSEEGSARKWGWFQLKGTYGRSSSRHMAGQASIDVREAEALVRELNYFEQRDIMASQKAIPAVLLYKLSWNIFNAKTARKRPAWPVVCRWSTRRSILFRSTHTTVLG